MGKPISFKPKSHDPQLDVHSKLEGASVTHAAAILNLYELLKEAEGHGVLDLLRGSIHAGHEITSKLAEYANTPLGITAIRNLLVLGKVLGTVNPELLNHGVNAMTEDIDREMNLHRQRPPSALGTLKKALSGDALRGLSLTISIMASLGRTLRSREK